MGGHVKDWKSPGESRPPEFEGLLGYWPTTLTIDVAGQVDGCFCFDGKWFGLESGKELVPPFLWCDAPETPEIDRQAILDYEEMCRAYANSEQS